MTGAMSKHLCELGSLFNGSLRAGQGGQAPVDVVVAEVPQLLQVLPRLLRRQQREVGCQEVNCLHSAAQSQCEHKGSFVGA